MARDRKQWTAWTTLNGARCPPCPLPYDGDDALTEPPYAAVGAPCTSPEWPDLSEES